MAFDPKRPGGTEGGGGSFLIGVCLLVAGFWLVFSRVVIHGGHFFGGFMSDFGHGGSVAVMLVPFVLGIAVLFSNARSKLGWGLLGAAILLLTANVIMSLEIYFRPTGLPTFLAMFAFIGAGLGMIVKGLFAR